MREYSTVFGIFLLFLLCITQGGKSYEYRRKSTSNEFDVLIFTQRWPPTVCYMWKEHSESHSCVLPKRDEWTIHGIWPSQFHRFGPEFCNRSMSFNSSTLTPIEKQLKESWIDIQNGSKPYSFWKHEWDKHGTCAVVLKPLENEYKYFQTGLELLDTYNMIDVLAKANILPGRKYMVQNILLAIQRYVGKRGQVTCTKNDMTGESYVFEIRICFDKALELTDCDGISNFPTNCDRTGLIMYPGHVPHNYHVIQI